MHFDLIGAQETLAVVIAIDEVDRYVKLAFTLNELLVVVAITGHGEEGGARLVSGHDGYAALAANCGQRWTGFRNDDFERAMSRHRRANQAQMAKQTPAQVDWFAIHVILF